jgi:hypothetical protein
METQYSIFRDPSASNRKFKGGRLVLHKRKPRRHPVTAAYMAQIRARGANGPAARRAKLLAETTGPYRETDRMKLVES